MLENLPQKYSDDDYRVKCETVYQHVYDSYYGAGRRMFGAAGLRVPDNELPDLDKGGWAILVGDYEASMI